MISWRTPGGILPTLLRHFSKQSKAQLLTKAYLTTVLITVIDYVSGPDLSLLIFYFFPIIVISWFLGKRQGFFIAVAVALATGLHDLLQTPSSFALAGQDSFHYWRFLQRGGVFLMVSFIIAALRGSESEKRNIELRLARTVQAFLLPQTVQSMGDLICFGRCKSSDHLTGDFFDLIPLGPTKLAILIGDICGKGVSAALLMAYIQGLLRSHVPFVEENLGELMNNINRSLHRVTADDKFATLFIGVYDEEQRQLTYVNAGHDSPVIYRLHTATSDTHSQNKLPSARMVPGTPFGTVSSVEAMKLENGELLLGVDPGFEYHTASRTLRDGDVLVCDTDGIKEAFDKRGQMYGSERLADVVVSHHGESAEKILDHILQDVETFVSGEPQADDMTLIVGTVGGRPS